MLEYNDMIGQFSLITKINQLLENKTFPRFSIFTGAKGSGKDLIAYNIANELTEIVVSVGSKVDSIREMIQSTYKLSEPCTYIISNADNMSLAAKNALLKVTEEPPNNAYFIMTLRDENQTLETIRSRGTIFHMDLYAPAEIKKFALDNVEYNQIQYIQLFQDLCSTPGDVEQLASYDILDFYDYVCLVFNNIDKVSGANAFKIGNRINFKDGSDKFDLQLFWRAFIHLAMEQCRAIIQNGTTISEVVEDFKVYLQWVRITQRYLQELNIGGINKAATFDSWLLDIREVRIDEDS